MVGVNAIPNPNRVVTIKGSEEEVNKWLYKICPYINDHIKSGYYQIKLDQTLGRLEIGKSEFLSLGVKIVIDTNYITDDSTEVNIEIQRQVGAFDQTYEITYANEHLSNAVEAVKYLSKNLEYVAKIPYSSINDSSGSISNSSSNSSIGAFGVVALILLVLWHLIK